ncbi:hypothetical protein BU24DRAFT_425148 [Aaosphaeria arxii CBS 175.79]|uniref:Uncharacterized protein n=1 Tax=Aaosphaeria arxii CBS 175.79 TaxID=1450172 RepID=A0A6A5XI58_9PLEO|nr:uncharacterized protein BU24DRAFT_425148 [Aaosphaeria arxii CBS 175.79]KAF2012501.1 hypothetical protein BU24DRAFT_425148 [Aaosphaeria arxii CBS 175.79]
MKKVLGYFQPPPPPPPSAGSARLTSTVSDVYECGPNVIYDSRKDTTRRINFGNLVSVFGYPSRGGVVILEDTSPADFDFLDLNRADPPMTRHEDPADEDAFCQRLLLLGAKWWDSLARYHLLNGEDVDVHELDESDEPEPTQRERHWVSVAWPSGGGGLVVAEFDTNMWNPPIEKELVPMDVARLRLCTSMDEKARMLRDRFGGRDWGRVEDYRGNAFMGCWAEKESGEVGELQKTWS